MAHFFQTRLAWQAIQFRTTFHMKRRPLGAIRKFQCLDHIDMEGENEDNGLGGLALEAA